MKLFNYIIFILFLNISVYSSETYVNNSITDFYIKNSNITECYKHNRVLNVYGNSVIKVKKCNNEINLFDDAKIIFGKFKKRVKAYGNSTLIGGTFDEVYLYDNATIKYKESNLSKVINLVTDKKLKVNILNAYNNSRIIDVIIETAAYLYDNTQLRDSINKKGIIHLYGKSYIDGGEYDEIILSNNSTIFDGNIDTIIISNNWNKNNKTFNYLTNSTKYNDLFLCSTDDINDVCVKYNLFDLVNKLLENKN
jgi:hypothetical protein